MFNIGDKVKINLDLTPHGFDIYPAMMEEIETGLPFEIVNLDVCPTWGDYAVLKLTGSTRPDFLCFSYPVGMLEMTYLN